MRKANLAGIIAGLAILVIFVWAAYIAGAASASTGSAYGTDKLLAQIRGQQKPDLVNRALSMLKNDYFMLIDEEQEQHLLYGAISGMTNVLRQEPFKDDFSHFYDPELYKDLQAQTTGEYAGVGILMGSTADGLYPEIVTVFPETPAAEAGIEPDDIITEVAGEDTFGMILPEVATRIKGEPGSSVDLTLYRPAEGEYYDLTVERRDVQFSSVSDVEMLEGGTGFVRISSFAEDTAADFRAAVEQLLDTGMQALVIDLRNNSGGLYPAAIDVANCFVLEGLIVEVMMRNDETQPVYADPDARKYELPLVVLINANSASASEILVGALQDHGLAKVIGERSYGKGVIQAVNPMEAEWVEKFNDEGRSYREEQVKSALALTIGKYYTPLHNDIHGVGIEPDVWHELANRLAEEPELKALETQIREQTDELRQLRAQFYRYIRDNDATRDLAIEIAGQLGRGMEVADVPQVELPLEEHAPLVSVPPSSQSPSMDADAESAGGE